MPADQQPLQPLDVLQRYRVEEAAKYLRVSRATVWNDVTAGRIRSVRHGRRVFVPGSEIARLSTVEAA
jgi:excisionase family DNA binding protein